MSQEPIPRLILTMAVPSILSMLVASLYSMADAFFVGRLPVLATESTASVTLVGPLLIVIQGVGLAFGMGASSFISRLLGQGKPKEANQVLSTSFHSSWILGVIMLVLGQLCLTPVLRFLGTADDLMPLASRYAAILLLGAPFLSGSFVMNNALRAEGSIIFSTIGMITGAVLNIILDPIFIFTLDMGVAGAAWATILCQIISFAILLSFYIRKRSMLSLAFRFFTPRKWVYSNVLKIGIPTFVRNALGAVSSGLVNGAAIVFGNHAVAALGIVNRFAWVIFSTLLGFAQAYMPVTGFNWGARRYSRVRKAYAFSLKVAVGFMTFSGVLLLLFASPVAHALHQDPEVSLIAARVLRAQALTYPLIGFGVITNMLFEALGKALPAALLSLGRQGIFLIITVLVLPPLFGLSGLIAAQPVADLLFGIMAVPMAIAITRQLRGMTDDPVPLPSAPVEAP